MDTNDTYDEAFNFTDSDWPNDTDYIDPKLMERYLTNKDIDEPAYTTLIVMYCFLIIVGALGNTLVVMYTACTSGKAIAGKVGIRFARIFASNISTSEADLTIQVTSEDRNAGIGTCYFSLKDIRPVTSPHVPVRTRKRRFQMSEVLTSTPVKEEQKARFKKANTSVLRNLNKDLNKQKSTLTEHKNVESNHKTQANREDYEEINGKPIHDRRLDPMQLM